MEQQLLQEQKKPNVLAFKVSIIFAFFLLLLMVLMGVFGINVQIDETPVIYKIISGALNWLPFIYAIYYVQNTHKKELGGFITFGRAFSAGFKVAAYSGLFTGILIFLYYQFIDQAGMAEIIDASIAKANGNQQQIQGIEMMRPYFTITAAFGSAVMYTISGLVISLITAAILKRDRPLHFEDPQL